MNKRRLHHVWTKLRLIKPWYFLILTILSGVICIFALRANNQHMVKLRTAVEQADQNNTDIQAPLKALQAYVTTHMNTDLSAGRTAIYPPIQLVHTYDRLVKAQSAAYTQANSQLYSAAQAYCEAQNSHDFSGRNRVPCIEDYVQSHSTQKLAPIPDALYKFAFASPRWSPDLAGWSLVLTIVSGLLFVVSLVSRQLLKRLSK